MSLPKSLDELLQEGPRAVEEECARDRRRPSSFRRTYLPWLFFMLRHPIRWARGQRYSLHCLAGNTWPVDYVGLSICAGRATRGRCWGEWVIGGQRHVCPRCEPWETVDSCHAPERT